MGLGNAKNVYNLFKFGAYSGAISEYADQIIDNTFGEGGGYDLKRIVKSAGIGGVASMISGKLLKATEAYVDKQVARAIANTETSGYKNMLAKQLRKIYPTIGNRQLNAAVNQDLKEIQNLLKKQGVQIKIALTEIINQSSDIITDEVKKNANQ